MLVEFKLNESQLSRTELIIKSVAKLKRFKKYTYIHAGNVGGHLIIDRLTNGNQSLNLSERILTYKGSRRLLHASQAKGRQNHINTILTILGHTLKDYESNTNNVTKPLNYLSSNSGYRWYENELMYLTRTLKDLCDQEGFDVAIKKASNIYKNGGIKQKHGVFEWLTDHMDLSKAGELVDLWIMDYNY